MTCSITQQLLFELAINKISVCLFELAINEASVLQKALWCCCSSKITILVPFLATL